MLSSRLIAHLRRRFLISVSLVIIRCSAVSTLTLKALTRSLPKHTAMLIVTCSSLDFHRASRGSRAVMSGELAVVQAELARVGRQEFD